MHQGTKLYELIKKEGLKQKEAALQMGYSPEYLSKLIKREELPASAMNKAKQVFNVTDSFFLENGHSPLQDLHDKRIAELEAEIARLKEENENERNRLLKIIENLSSK